MSSAVSGRSATAINAHHSLTVQPDLGYESRRKARGAGRQIAGWPNGEVVRLGDLRSRTSSREDMQTMKKLITLGVAVVAVAAFAMPAAASALEMRDSSGKVALGSEITGVSHNTFTTNTALGTLYCETVEVTGEITVNGPSSITEVGTAAETSECEASGEPQLITAPTLEHLVATGNDEGLLSLSFISDVGPFECPYGGTLGFTYGTGSGNDTLSFSGEIGSPFEFCEGEEAATFEGTFTLTTTETGEPVFIQ